MIRQVCKRVLGFAKTFAKHDWDIEHMCTLRKHSGGSVFKPNLMVIQTPIVPVSRIAIDALDSPESLGPLSGGYWTVEAAKWNISHCNRSLRLFWPSKRTHRAPRRFCWYTDTRLSAPKSPDGANFGFSNPPPWFDLGRPDQNRLFLVRPSTGPRPWVVQPLLPQFTRLPHVSKGFRWIFGHYPVETAWFAKLRA